jgi:hypothetical protein
MAEVLQLSRNTKVYIKDTQSDGANSSGAMWQIPVLDGYAFSQATEAVEITLSEASDAAGTSRRGSAKFNTALAPVEWSLTTYARPFKGAGSMSTNSGRWDGTGGANNTHATEEPLWAYFVLGTGLNFTMGNTTANSVWADGVTSNTTSMLIDFTGSNKTALRVFELYFVLGAAASGQELSNYKLVDACVNSVTMDFDIEGIAQLQWSGYAKNIVSANTNPYIANTIFEGLTSTNTLIRNRLSTLTCNTSNTGDMAGFANTYNITLTGGSITLENNISYLTPEELAKVNIPLGHVTGSRSVSGTFTAYLNDDYAANSSGKLYRDLTAQTSVTTTVFGLNFSVGGAGIPRVEYIVPRAALEIPTHSIDDVIGLEFTFKGLPSTLSQTDEATIKYTGPIPV